MALRICRRNFAHVQDPPLAPFLPRQPGPSDETDFHLFGRRNRFFTTITHHRSLLFPVAWGPTVSDLAHDLGSAVCNSLDTLNLATCGDRMSVLTIGFALLLLAGIGVVGFGLSRIA